MDSNDDKYQITPIIDCKGTCKTPIGCTCGKSKKEEEIEVEIFATPKPESQAPVIDTPKSVVKTEPSTQCTCGKNEGGACGCKTGEGCNTTKDKKKCDSCSKQSKNSCCSGKNKLEVYNWLNDLPEAESATQMIEVQLKNTRKAYYLNSNNLELYKGDIVAVEATPGHDIGEVTLTGKLVLLQMKKMNYRPLQGEHKRVYRVAKQTDLDKFKEAKSREHATMLRAREMAEEIGLNMKISDVEYQGDNNKAIFYYIADERVDFRQLIKVYAEKFRVKIEMKQIGARQEAGRVGGIGPCGRELCCSSSISSFVSVSTSSARFQDISLNPQKLAGQCGKLKCCLNYEVDTYVEAQRQLPSREIALETRDSSYYHFKTDILSGMMTYSTSKDFPANTITVDKERAFEIIRMNRKGHRPLTLVSNEEKVEEQATSKDILEQENINRFDDSKKKRVSKNGNGGNGGGNNNAKKTFRNSAEVSKAKEGAQGEEADNNKAPRPPRRNRENRPDNKPEGKQANGSAENPNPNPNPNPNRNNNNRRRNNQPRKNNENTNNNNTKNESGSEA